MGTGEGERQPVLCEYDGTRTPRTGLWVRPEWSHSGPEVVPLVSDDWELRRKETHQSQDPCVRGPPPSLPASPRSDEWVVESEGSTFSGKSQWDSGPPTTHVPSIYESTQPPPVLVSTPVTPVPSVRPSYPRFLRSRPWTTMGRTGGDQGGGQRNDQGDDQTGGCGSSWTTTVTKAGCRGTRTSTGSSLPSSSYHWQRRTDCC